MLNGMMNCSFKKTIEASCVDDVIVGIADVLHESILAELIIIDTQIADTFFSSAALRKSPKHSTWGSILLSSTTNVDFPYPS